MPWQAASVSMAAMVLALRAILKEEDTEAPTSGERAVQTGVFIAAGFVATIWGFITANLLYNAGNSMGWGFIGNFVATLGEVTRLLLPVIAIAGAIGMVLFTAVGMALAAPAGRGGGRRISPTEAASQAATAPTRPF